VPQFTIAPSRWWRGTAFLGQAKQAFERVPSCRHFITVNQTPGDTTAPEGTLSMNAVISSAEAVGDPTGDDAR